MKKVVEFDNIPDVKGKPLHLKVTRQDDGRYSMSVSLINPNGQRHGLLQCRPTHAQVQAIADLAEAP